MSVFREKSEELDRYEFQMGLERGRLVESDELQLGPERRGGVEL